MNPGAAGTPPANGFPCLKRPPWPSRGPFQGTIPPVSPETTCRRLPGPPEAFPRHMNPLPTGTPPTNGFPYRKISPGPGSFPWPHGRHQRPGIPTGPDTTGTPPADSSPHRKRIPWPFRGLSKEHESRCPRNTR